MTEAQPTERRTRTKKRGGRFVTDAELIEKLGVPEKVGYSAIRSLDRMHGKTGFPQKQAMWGDRRDWDAVALWLDKNSGIIPQETRRRA